jgi:predicted methyltransferase
MRSLYQALQPGGEVVVVDFKRVAGASRPWVLEHVRAGQQMTVAEIRACGFEWLADAPGAPFLEENYLLRFRKPH